MRRVSLRHRAKWRSGSCTGTEPGSIAGEHSASRLSGPRLRLVHHLWSRPGARGGSLAPDCHAIAPSHIDPDAVLVGLLARLEAADPGMLAEMGADGGDIATLVAMWPRLVSRTTPQRRIAVLAGSRRQRRRLEAVALRAGWLVVGGSADEDDPVVLSRLALSPDTAAVLLGADRSAGGDEKRHLPDLAALVAAITRSRPELTVVLAGGAAAYESDFGHSANRR